MVIGFDFGNYYSQPCVIVGMDEKTLRGGTVYDLVDPTSVCLCGIPSAFFYSSKKYNAEPQFGHQAETSSPATNCVRYLKRHLGEQVTIDGKTFDYDDIIVQVFSYCVRQANKRLSQLLQTTTNKIALSYPASYNSSQREHLVSLAKRATLEDGTHVEVCGTIAEPAAAALDYLAENSENKEKVVLAYDLGGGTFDASVVKIYPNGAKSSNGKKKYYEILINDGAKIGGAEFDEIICRIIAQKSGNALEGRFADIVRNLAEPLKRELSDSESCQPMFFNPVSNNFFDQEITRDEFEALARPLIKKTVDMVKEMLANPNIPKPDNVILTGGASQMPIVQKVLREELPEYADKIVFHKPSKAIACGAARFHTDEGDPDFVENIVEQRTSYELGIRFYKNKADKKGYITPYIPKDTPVPFDSKSIVSYQLYKGDHADFWVYEAKCKNPDRNEVDRDYNRIMAVTYFHDKVMPEGKSAKTKLTMDKNNLLQITVTDPDDPSKPPLKENHKLYSLS